MRQNKTVYCSGTCGNAIVRADFYAYFFRLQIIDTHFRQNELFQVRYWRRGENIYVAKNIDVGKQIRYVLRGLEQYTQYELRVYGYSRGGDGLQSSPTLEFIIGLLYSLICY